MAEDKGSNTSINTEGPEAKKDKKMNLLLKVITFLSPFILTKPVTAIVAIVADIQYPIFLGFPLLIALLVFGFYLIKNNGYHRMAKDYRRTLILSSIFCIGLFLLEEILVRR